MMYILVTAAKSQEGFTKIMADLGYETKTTFYQDFTIADMFGVDAVKDTYNRAFNEWKSNIEYITEFVLTLNHKIWEHHLKNNADLMATYDTLWRQADEWCMNNLTDEDLTYYLKTTD